LELEPAEVEFYLELVVLEEQLFMERLLQVGPVELVVVVGGITILSMLILHQVELVVQLMVQVLIKLPQLDTMAVPAVAVVVGERLVEILRVLMLEVRVVKP
jgi:hypothetical protein